MKEQDLISSQRGAGKPEARISGTLQRTLCQGVAVAALAFAFAPNAAKSEVLSGTNNGPNLPSDSGIATALAGGSGTGSVNGALIQPNPTISNNTAAYAIAIGAGSVSSGGTSASNSSVAVGSNSTAYSQTDSAFGSSANANSSMGGIGVATGPNPVGTSDWGATAVGSYTKAYNQGATALGQFAQTGLLPTDINTSGTSGSGTNALPTNANPLIPTITSGSVTAGKIAAHAVNNNASFATALGNWSIAQGYNTSAVGQFSSATGDNATAFGQSALASAANAAAVGQGSIASGNNSVSVGNGALSGSALFTLSQPCSGSVSTNCYNTVGNIGGTATTNNLLSSANIAATTGQGTAGDTSVGFFSTAVGGSSTAIGGTDATYNQTNAANQNGPALTGANAAYAGLGATSAVAIGGGASEGNGAAVTDGSVGGVAIGGGSNGYQGATAGFNLLHYYQGKPAFGAAPGAIAIGGSDGISLGASAANAGDIAIGTLSSAIGGGNGNATPGSCGEGVPGVCGGTATALGYQATAWYQGTTAIGNYSYAIGKDASGGFDTAVGNYAWVADVNNGTAIGQFSFVKGNNGTAVGQGAFATADDSSSFGQGSWASGDKSTALGTGAYAGSAALGPYTPGSSTTGVGTVGDVAVGYFATAAGGYSTALGTNAQAYGQNSIAIGAGAVANNANQVVLGAPGVLQASTGSQVGPTNFVTSDANGTLGTSQFGPGSIAALNASVANLYMGQASLQQQLYGNRREARQGIAIAYVGGANAPMPSAPGKVTYILNAGAYKNQGAIAGAFSYRLPTSFPLALTAGVSVGFNSSAAAKGGLQGEF